MTGTQAVNPSASCSISTPYLAIGVLLQRPEELVQGHPRQGEHVAQCPVRHRESGMRVDHRLSPVLMAPPWAPAQRGEPEAPKRLLHLPAAQPRQPAQGNSRVYVVNIVRCVYVVNSSSRTRTEGRNR